MKILTLDIETSPNLADVWGLWQQNVSLSQLRESSRVISFAAKWHDRRQIMFKSEFHDGHDEMVAEAYNLLSDADAVVHYNGKTFDIPTLNKEFALSDMLGPPAPFEQIDLLSVVKKNFRFPSNKLQYVADKFGVGQKEAHEGHIMWVKCMAGDPKAWAQMKKYNIQDVRVTERLYDKLLPWIGTHPNRRLYDKPEGCPRCGADWGLIKQGTRRTQTGSYQRFLCTQCGGWSTGGRRIEGSTMRGMPA